ncbi:MAG: DUF721 domain-containing protein [Nocardioidaceae bacterium]
MSGDEADPGADPEPQHDLTGLDLARSVAASYRSTAPDARKAALRSRATPYLGRRRSPSGPSQASGAHPDERDPQTLDVTVGRLVSDRGWRADVAVHGVFSRWDQVVGSEVAEHVVPERYIDTELTVRADSTAWATQMRLLASQVLARLNAELGHGTVTRIHVQGPQAPSWKHGPRSVKGRGPRDTYG